MYSKELMRVVCMMNIRPPDEHLAKVRIFFVVAVSSSNDVLYRQIVLLTVCFIKRFPRSFHRRSLQRFVEIIFPGAHIASVAGIRIVA